jgi:NTP pyrophosphatase (non-canonical NTP hydrolase)
MTITLPEIDWRSQNWTPAQQLRKVAEEMGEVAEAVAENNPVQVIRESLDAMQTYSTLIHIIAAEYAISIDKLIEEHTEKLIRKGYMMSPLTDPAAWLEEQGITEYCINWESKYIILQKYDLDKLISLNKLDYPQQQGWNFFSGKPIPGNSGMWRRDES